MSRATLLLLLLLHLATPSIANEPAVRLRQPHDRGERQRQRRTPVVEVFEKSKNAVVNISTTQFVEVRSPFGSDSLLEDLFDFPSLPGEARRYKTSAVGSGFILHSSGYIVTNAHVVARTAERKVILSDKSEYEAEVVASDPRRDLAILKINANKPLERISLGTSDDLMIGETVIAIGNPLGLDSTVTTGVISALHRKLEARGQVILEELIQTDASINPGNSGGPLFNILGELVGITTAIRGDAQNIGFAIPVNQLVETLPELLSVERRYRIIAGLDVDPFQEPRVRAVAPESPADHAGIAVGDILRVVNGESLSGGIDFYIALIGKKAGDAVMIELERDGKRFKTEVPLAAMPKPDGAQLASAKLGVVLEPVTEEVAQKLGLSAVRGLVVNRVEANGPAASAGIEAGDIVVELSSFAPQSLDDVGLLLEEVQSGAPLQVGILRLGKRLIYRLKAMIEVR